MTLLFYNNQREKGVNENDKKKIKIEIQPNTFLLLSNGKNISTGGCSNLTIKNNNRAQINQPDHPKGK